jgi:hypothetical protein
MIQQYNTVINSLNQFSEAHLSLKRFKSSFFEQIDNFSTSGNTFPILYAIPNDVVFDENIDRMSFRVYVVDILQKDRSNEQSILNETLLILRDLTNWFRQDTTNNLNILNNPRCTPVNNFGVEFTVGWYADYEIEVTQSTSECSIPFSQNFVFTGTSCDISYVNPYLTCETLELCQGYIDLDNQLITGGTYNTSASTINLITKGGDIINITGITAGGGSQNLAQVLSNGNSVSGQTITSTNGNYYLSKYIKNYGMEELKAYLITSGLDKVIEENVEKETAYQLEKFPFKPKSFMKKIRPLFYHQYLLSALHNNPYIIQKVKDLEGL